MNINDGISIVVVGYNSKKWFDGFFSSLLSQIYKNFEVVFVDNNSNDDSLEILNNRYKDKLDLNIIQNHRNVGFAGGNNLGIKNAKNDYILLLNVDVKFEPDFLEKIISFYKDNNYDVLSPSQAPYSGGVSKKENYTIDIFGYPTMLDNKVFYLNGCCLFFKKGLYDSTFGLDSNFFMYSEEVDWFWRLNLFDKKIFCLDNVFIYHASYGVSQKISYNVFLWRNQNMLQMLLKNYSWYNLLWILPIYFIQNIFEITFFLIILKPKIAFSYIEGWWFNIKNIRKILINRKNVQNHRVVTDAKVIKNMHFGSAKLSALFNFIRHVKKI